MERTPRVPVQERALRRREALLDAAARILERDGYDGLSTNAVAREAGASVGTVYEYFSDKQSLIEALLTRHGERLTGAIEGALASGAGDVGATADLVVDAFAKVWRHEPGYRAVWSVTRMSSLLDRTGAEWADALNAPIVAVIRAAAPALSHEEARIVAVTAIHLVSGLLLAAMTGPKRQESAVVRETKVALRAYLSAKGIHTTAQ